MVVDHYICLVQSGEKGSKLLCPMLIYQIIDKEMTEAAFYCYHFVATEEIKTPVLPCAHRSVSLLFRAAKCEI